jgi:hypothetical protein
VKLDAARNFSALKNSSMTQRASSGSRSRFADAPQFGHRQCPIHSAPTRAIADPQSTNGTLAKSQRAAFPLSLEFGLGRPNSDLTVGHEGLEPSTNGLRRLGEGRGESEPVGFALSTAASADRGAASRIPA